MANGLYDGGRGDFATADIDWINDDIKAMLVDTDEYTINLTSDNYLNEILSVARIGTATITGKSQSAGICDANDTTFTNITAGQSIGAVIVFKNSGFENSSRLIVAYDTAVNLPATSDGTDIVIQWPSTTNKMFKL